MKNKFIMTPVQNRRFVHSRLNDYLLNSMLLARYDVTKENILDPNTLGEESEEKTALLNFMTAYAYLLNEPVEETCYEVLMKLHTILMMDLMDTFENQLTEEQIVELNAMIDQPAKANTEIALDCMMHILGKRLFTDGDVRVALMFANKIMIGNGCGFITVAPNMRDTFRKILKEFNASGDPLPMKEWLYANCIKGKMMYD